MKPEEIGLDEARGSGADGKQPFLVAFFKNGPKLGGWDAGARRKREARRWRTHGYTDNYLRNPLTGQFCFVLSFLTLNSMVYCVTNN